MVKTSYPFKVKADDYVLSTSVRDSLGIEKLKKVSYNNISIAQWVVSGLDSVIVSRGLGSCLAIAIYDKSNGITGFFHAMLPSMDIGIDKKNKTKYVREGVYFITRKMRTKGADIGKLKVKYAGGASMFSSTVSDIGRRNIEMAESVFREMGITTVACDVGGKIGRTVSFYTTNYNMHIKTVWGGEKVI